MPRFSVTHRKFCLVLLVVFFIGCASGKGQRKAEPTPPPSRPIPLGEIRGLSDSIAENVVRRLAEYSGQPNGEPPNLAIYRFNSLIGSARVYVNRKINEEYTVRWAEVFAENQEFYNLMLEAKGIRAENEVLYRIAEMGKSYLEQTPSSQFEKNTFVKFCDPGRTAGVYGRPFLENLPSADAENFSRQLFANIAARVFDKVITSSSGGEKLNVAFMKARNSRTALTAEISQTENDWENGIREQTAEKIRKASEKKRRENMERLRQRRGFR